MNKKNTTREDELPLESIEEEQKEEYLSSGGNVNAAELIVAYRNGDKRAFVMLCGI